jgi:hypothetical protein
MSYNGIISTHSSRRQSRDRIAGVPGYDAILAAPDTRLRPSVEMPEPNRQVNQWVRDEARRISQRPDDERLIRVGGPR